MNNNKNNAMAVNNCLKISYHGLLRFILCEAKSTYEDILNIAIERFAIPNEYAECLQISNEQGYIFDKQLLEYFLLLFPQPQIVFYIKVNYIQLRKLRESRKAMGDQSSQYYSVKRRQPCGYSKLNNKRPRLVTEEDDEKFQAYVDDGEDDGVGAVPVHRQNCFLGCLPTANEALQRRQREVEYTKKVKKQLLSMQTAKRPKLMSSLRKKSMRI